MDRPRTAKRNIVLWSPLAPLVPCVHTKCPQALLWRQHCGSTFLADSDSLVQLKATIQKATDVGAVGSADYANVGDGGRANPILGKGLQKDGYQ